MCHRASRLDQKIGEASVESENKNIERTAVNFI